MTISEIIAELEQLAQETSAILRDMDYTVSSSGERVYAPWEHIREKQVCLGMISALTDLQNILQDPLLSDYEKQDRFLSETDKTLKRWNKQKDPDACGTLRQDLSRKLLEMTCFIGLLA